MRSLEICLLAYSDRFPRRKLCDGTEEGGHIGGAVVVILRVKRGCSQMASIVTQAKSLTLPCKYHTESPCISATVTCRSAENTFAIVIYIFLTAHVFVLSI